MRRGERAAASVLALALVATPALAAVEGSPHDLISQGYDVQKSGGSQERCTVCHAVARAAAQGLLKVVPPSLEKYGAGGLVCFSCHDGITLVAPEVDASLSAFHPGSHGHDSEKYRNLREEGEDIAPGEGESQDCTNCHDPHDSANRPFLRAAIGEICLQCHSPLAEFPTEGGINNSGNHPLGRDPMTIEHPGMPIQVTNEFAVPFPAAYPLQKGKGSAGTHWDLGGHLLKGSAGEVSCVTCHAVHGDEVAPPSRALLAKDPVGEVADEFCEGCHRGRRGDGVISNAAPNPGGTLAGRTYHPCDDDVANGEGRLVEILVPEGWPLGGGTPARLLCTTCHRSHRAELGTRLLRAPVRAANFCMECHEDVSLEYHHPAGRVEGACATLRADDVGGTAVLSCESCHRAHNAGLGSGEEREYVPILKEAMSSPRQCAPCHPSENPTCGTMDSHKASHFMGDPTSNETYGDPDPPLRKEPWPESNLPSRYGRGERGDTIVCLSCHIFSKEAVQSGDSGTFRFLLARSGNPLEWKEGEEDKYLCLGCHGVNPGTGEKKGGHSHPLMNADAEKLGRVVSPPASITPSGHVNCDSCHRPHEAITKGGYYILEKVDGPNTDPEAVQPQIDYTVTCHLCHMPEKY